MSYRRLLRLGGAARGPILNLDFTQPGLDPRIQSARSSAAYAWDNTGSLVSIPANTPRQDFGPLAITTNMIRNSTMVGASASVLPTNWSANFGSGITAISGAPFTDANGQVWLPVAISGTSTATGSTISTIGFETTTSVAALVGQTLTLAGSFYCSGTIPLISLDISERNSSGANLIDHNGSAFTVPTTASRSSISFTMANSSCAFALPRIFFSQISGTTYNGTLYIAAPQLEQSPVATTYVPTSGTINSAVVNPVGARINWIANSTMQGAGAGVAPTGWQLSGITAAGTANDDFGRPALLVNGSGTGSGGGNYSTLDANYRPAVIGQVWTMAIDAKLVSGALTGGTFGLFLEEFNSSNTFLLRTQATLSFVISGTEARFTGTATVQNAATSSIRATLRVSFTNGTVYSFQIQLSAPQLEIGNTATAFIPTSGSIASSGALAQGLLNEPAGSNQIRNPRGEGASGSTAPTNWPTTISAGLTSTFTQVAENGIPCVDWSVSGTTTASGYLGISFESPIFAAASSGQTWTASVTPRLLNGALPTTMQLNVVERSSGGTNLAQGSTNLTITSGPIASQRQNVSRVFNQATTAFVNSNIYSSVSLASGTTINFTLRIGLPQLEQSPIATSPMLPAVGTPAVSLRAAEVNYIDGLALNQTQGSMQIEYLFNARDGAFGSPLSLVGAASAGTDYISVGEYTTGGPTAPTIAGSSLAAGGVGVNCGSTFPVLNSGTLVKQASSWLLGGTMKSAYQGTSWTPSAQIAGLPSVTRLQIAGIMHFQNGPNIATRKLRYWPRALSATELQVQTT